MQKKFTKAFICTTAVLATIGLMLISAVYSGDTSNSEIPLVKSGAVIKETTKSEIIVESTEQPKMTTEKIITHDTKPEITRQEKPTESKEPVEIHTTTEASSSNDVLYSASQFMELGIIHWNGWRWTYYSEKVLPGGGLDIPGRHNDTDGYVCDENDYICLSSSSLSKGTVIDTPFGKRGMVYDTGCPSDVIDVYVNW